MDFTGLGLRIKKRRKSLNMTQERLAETTNISISFLGHIERGSRKASIDTLVKIANALDISMDILLQESLTISAQVEGKAAESELVMELRSLLDNYSYLGDE